MSPPTLIQPGPSALPSPSTDPSPPPTHRLALRRSPLGRIQDHQHSSARPRPTVGGRTGPLTNQATHHTTLWASVSETHRTSSIRSPHRARKDRTLKSGACGCAQRWTLLPVRFVTVVCIHIFLST